MKKLIIAAIAATLLSAFPAFAYNKSENASAFSVEYNNVDIQIGDRAETIINNLGKPNTKIKLADGRSYTYEYNDVIIYTAKDSYNIETVTGITFTSSNVHTPEGVSIGDTYNRMYTAYGSGYSEKNGTYTYQQGNSSVSFLVDAFNKIKEILFS